MSGKEDYNFDEYISDVQKKVRQFEQEREQLNSKLRNYIILFQSIDSEIKKTIYDAREYYSNKRYDYSIKIAKLRREKVENERRWNFLTNRIKTLQKPELNSNITTSIEYSKRSLENIENNLTIMNEKIEAQILDIDEENELIEKIRELETNKQKTIKILADLKQKQLKNIRNSYYYKTHVEIKDVEKILREVYEKLIKLSNKRHLTHSKTLNLYKKAKEFEVIKRNIEMDLIENKNFADEFYQLFVKLMDLNKKLLLDELSNKPKIKIRPMEIKTPPIFAPNKKNKSYKRLEQKKLAIALHKQKTGKKLDFYEYQLILKYKKK
ncbi:MAG: hypothetical protein ACFFE5_05055 [Candidatus Thorarchaeota archaeon]